MISVRNVVKSYDKKKVLNEVNLEVSSNEIVGLMGPSGCGKSTMLRCIQGLEKIDAGEIDCQGSVGFVFQDFQLFPHMTVMENLLCAVYAKKDQFFEKAENILESLEVKGLAHMYPGTLSGGQKQRVALARALVLEPQVLLCDEPTSGLDAKTARGVSDLLKNVSKSTGSLIIASHDLPFLKETADRIVVFSEGKVVEKDLSN